MAIHNVMEDLVSSSVETIFDSIQKSGNPEGFCFCEQCKLDASCYVLNRIRPHCLVSSRGAARLEQESLEWQQMGADVASMIHKGLRQVNHNQRPTVTHKKTPGSNIDASMPVYSIPVIMGRIFDGSTFAPLTGAHVELRLKGELVIMRDQNWQNPYALVANTAGTFTFWPAPLSAEAPEDHKEFEFSIIIDSNDYESKTHVFKIPVVSTLNSAVPFSIDRAFKLPDIYMFPPGEAEQNG